MFLKWKIWNSKLRVVKGSVRALSQFTGSKIGISPFTKKEHEEG